MVYRDVLLVDDDRDTCDSMSDILLDIGYTVDIANDGPGALERSGQHHYRLALLDYKMPGMDGVELCRRLKKSQPSSRGGTHHCLLFRRHIGGSSRGWTSVLSPEAGEFFGSDAARGGSCQGKGRQHSG